MRSIPASAVTVAASGGAINAIGTGSVSLFAGIADIDTLVYDDAVPVYLMKANVHVTFPTPLLVTGTLGIRGVASAGAGSAYMQTRAL